MSRYSSIDKTKRCSRCGTLERDPYVSILAVDKMNSTIEEKTGKQILRKTKQLKSQPTIKLIYGLCNNCREKDMKKEKRLKYEQNNLDYAIQLGIDEVNKI
jgi:hypothetical protein